MLVEKLDPNAHFICIPVTTVEETKTRNYPAVSCGVSEELDENYPKVVTPECFYWGSSSGFAWIP